MKLTGMGVQNIGQFRTPQQVHLEEDVHLFLGPMGQGKTTLLRCAAIPFGVRVAGLAHNQMQEVVTTGSGAGRIALFFSEGGDSDEGFDLTWSPGKKASPASIRERFGVDPKNLEWMLTPSSLVAMSPADRRKMFSQALGSEPTVDDLIEAGLGDSALELVRDATVKRGFAAGIRKATEQRRALQNRLTSTAIDCPVNPTIDLGDGETVRAGDLSTAEVEALLREDDDALVRAAGAAGGRIERLESLRAKAKEIQERLDESGDADASVEAKIEAKRTDLASIEQKLADLEEQRRKAANECDRAENRARDNRAILTRVRHTTQDAHVLCDGRFRCLPSPENRCPKDITAAASIMEKEIAESEAMVEEALRPLLAETRQMIGELELEKKGVQTTISTLERSSGDRKRLESDLAKVTKAIEAEEGRQEAQGADETDVEAIRRHRDWLAGILGTVREYHAAVAEWKKAEPIRDALEADVAIFTKAEEKLAELQAAVAGDPIQQVQAKVDEICGPILPGRVSISEDWEVWYDGRRLALASKGQLATIDLALRAALTELAGFPILIVDDLDAIDAKCRQVLLFEVLGKLRHRFMKILCACWSNNGEPNDALRDAYPWLGRHFVVDGRVSHL